jgi:septum formation protein
VLQWVRIEAFSFTIANTHLLLYSLPSLDCAGIHNKVTRTDPRANLVAHSLLSRSIDERTLVYFSDNPQHVVKAYVESGEGIDRAGGFAIQVCYVFANNAHFTGWPYRSQGLGGLLIRKIEGDFHNVVGFPAASFFAFLDLLLDEEEFLEV